MINCFCLCHLNSRHRCPHGTTLDENFVSETTTVEKQTAYQKDFIDKKVTAIDGLRMPAIKPADNLKPEGIFDFGDKQPFRPAEKVVPTRPQDNLFVTGEFEGMDKIFRVLY